MRRIALLFLGLLLVGVGQSFAQDSKVRMYVTDEPVDFSSIIARYHSSSGSSSSAAAAAASNRFGSAAAASASSSSYSNGGGAVYGQHERGANPRTVEIQADIMKECPGITVTNDMTKANYVLLFRRANGHRSAMFAFGGLSGLALSAAMKVNGASLFESNGDMVYATKANSVKGAIKDVCGHMPSGTPPEPIGLQAPPPAAAAPAPPPTPEPMPATAVAAVMPAPVPVPMVAPAPPEPSLGEVARRLRDQRAEAQKAETK